MALIVEDGTGKADADAYVSLADASTYATAKGLIFPISGGDQTLAEQAIRRATTWIDGRYRSRFSGSRKQLRNQALEWPRINAFDAACPESIIDPDSVPVEIVQATVEAAVREKARPGSLSPDVTPGKIKKSFRAGQIAVEYAVGNGTAAEQRPVVGIIDGILAPLLGGSSSPYSGRAVRA